MISVEVHGCVCTLNKYRWSSTDPEVEEFLNQLTRTYPPPRLDPDPERTIFQKLERMSIFDRVLEFHPEYLGEAIDLWAFPDRELELGSMTGDDTGAIPDDWIPDDVSEEYLRGLEDKGIIVPRTRRDGEKSGP